jgi:demethylmenaquinone methyltransferase/2-methoxy-6-polyprenyl-1,4-benzoquinol methylase
MIARIQSSPNSRISYDRISSTYDWQTHLATGGQNLATRLSQIEDLIPGERVLYVGVGSGEDAIEAARRGSLVTCLDFSEGMVQRARERFAEARIPGEFVAADVMQYVPDQPFDAVVANFFLNVFSKPMMESILARLAGLVRPGGKLLIADCSPARGSVVLRAMHRAYYGAGNLLYWMKGLCALHPIYVYADYYPQLGLRLRKTRHFRIFRRGPWIFQTTVALKESAST